MFVYTGTLALSDDDDDDDERTIKASKMTTLTTRALYGHGKDIGKRQILNLKFIRCSAILELDDFYC